MTPEEFEKMQPGDVVKYVGPDAPIAYIVTHKSNDRSTIVRTHEINHDIYDWEIIKKGNYTRYPEKPEELQVLVGHHYAHIKNRSIYKVTAISKLEKTPEIEMVTYEMDGQSWVRPMFEFKESFEKL